MREGEGPVTKTSRSSLKLLGTVGEPINPEAWMWYYKVGMGETDYYNNANYNSDSKFVNFLIKLVFVDGRSTWFYFFVF